MMRTLKLTAKDFKTVDGYKEYTGREDLTDFEGNLEFEADLGWMKFGRIKVSGYILIEAGGSIEAGDWIEAGGSIKAGDWIKAGGWIEAGGSIKAGGSIEAVRGGILAGLYIKCTGILKFKLRLFAGVSPYSWNENCSKEVTCGKLEGNVVYGDVTETGIPDDKQETIEIGGITYDKSEVEKRLKDIKPVK